jgi:hypothetical protein
MKIVNVQVQDDSHGGRAELVITNREIIFPTKTEHGTTAFFATLPECLPLDYHSSYHDGC